MALTAFQIENILEVFGIENPVMHATSERSRLRINNDAMDGLREHAITLEALKTSPYWIKPTAEEVKDNVLGWLDGVKLCEFVNSLPKEFAVEFSQAVRRAPGFNANTAALEIAKEAGIPEDHITLSGMPAGRVFTVIDPTPEQLEALDNNASVKTVEEAITHRAM